MSLECQFQELPQKQNILYNKLIDCSFIDAPITFILRSCNYYTANSCDNSNCVSAGGQLDPAERDNL